MRAGALAHGGVDDADSGEAHGDTHQEPVECGAWDELGSWVVGVEEDDREDAGREHEDG